MGVCFRGISIICLRFESIAYADPVTLEVIDLTGRVIEVLQPDISDNYGWCSINQLEPGLFLFIVKCENKRLGSQKIVVE